MYAVGKRSNPRVRSCPFGRSVRNFAETGDTRCVAQALRFDRFAITVSTERVAWWIQRRSHHRAPLHDPGDTQTPAPRPHTRVVNRLLTLDQSDRHPRRERSFRPFRRYGVDGASRLVDPATVPPPCTIARSRRYSNSRSPPTYARR